MPDAIDEAIAAPTVRMVQRQVMIGASDSGRPFVFALPDDVTEAELFVVVGYLATAFRAEVAQRRRGPLSRLVLPQGARPG